MFLWSDIAEHRAAIPADHGGTDAAGDVIVAGSDMTGAFVHDLDTVSPSPLGEVALNFEFSKLGIIIGVGD